MAIGAPTRDARQRHQTADGYLKQMQFVGGKKVIRGSTKEVLEKNVIYEPS